LASLSCPAVRASDIGARCGGPRPAGRSRCESRVRALARRRFASEVGRPRAYRPGNWPATSPPSGPGMPQRGTWVLPSADAIRPAPPDYGSPQFTAVLTEVKNYGRSPQHRERDLLARPRWRQELPTVERRVVAARVGARIRAGLAPHSGFLTSEWVHPRRAALSTKRGGAPSDARRLFLTSSGRCRHAPVARAISGLARGA
jgi:hypothetical protein